MPNHRRFWSRRLEETPNDSAARYQLAAHKVMANDIGPALEDLLQIMQTTASL